MMAFNEPLENARAHLLSIYEKERRVEKGEEFVKHPDEFQKIQIDLWDYCDTLPLSTVENAIVELSGENIGDYYTPQRQRIITDLEDYIKARLDTGEAEV